MSSSEFFKYPSTPSIKINMGSDIYPNLPKLKTNGPSGKWGMNKRTFKTAVKQKNASNIFKQFGKHSFKQPVPVPYNPFTAPPKIPPGALVMRVVDKAVDDPNTLGLFPSNPPNPPAGPIAPPPPPAPEPPRQAPNMVDAAAGNDAVQPGPAPDIDPLMDQARELPPPLVVEQIPAPILSPINYDEFFDAPNDSDYGTSDVGASPSPYVPPRPAPIMGSRDPLMVTGIERPQSPQLTQTMTVQRSSQLGIAGTIANMAVEAARRAGDLTGLTLSTASRAGVEFASSAVSRITENMPSATEIGHTIGRNVASTAVAGVDLASGTIAGAATQAPAMGRAIGHGIGSAAVAGTDLAANTAREVRQAFENRNLINLLLEAQPTPETYNINGDEWRANNNYVFTPYIMEMINDALSARSNQYFLFAAPNNLHNFEEMERGGVAVIRNAGLWDNYVITVDRVRKFITFRSMDDIPMSTRRLAIEPTPIDSPQPTESRRRSPRVNPMIGPPPPIEQPVEEQIRRSTRINKGVPPKRYG